MTTLLLSHSECLAHVTPPGHPEQVARLEAINAALADPKYDALKREEAPLAEEADIALCHPRAYVEAVKAATPEEGFAQLDPDTHMSPGSWKAALRGVGANLRAVDRVLGGAAANAFCAIRPPGFTPAPARPMSAVRMKIS